jgi:hypothetical protein
MNNSELMNKIESAKDTFGVITPTGLHDQLSSLTVADWRQAAAIYSSDSPTASDGFYISDDAAGKVTIHNNLTDAREHANSALDATGADVTSVVGWAAAGTAAWALTAGFASGFVASESVEVGGAAVAAAAGSGAVGALAVGGAIAGTIGAAVLAVDYGRNLMDQSAAQNDVRNYAQITW